MLSTTVTTNGNDESGGGNPSAEHRHHFTATTTKAKDDTCTQTRVRHPTDRGYDPSAAPLSPTMFGSGSHFFDNAAEARSRAYTYSANGKPYVGRMNVYKRAGGAVSCSTRESSNGDKNINSASAEQNAKHAVSNGCESPSRTSSKRESWLQRSWKSAQSHRPILPKQISPATASPSFDHQQQADSNSRDAPTVVGAHGAAKPITGFLGRFRPRSSSDATGVVAAQQALISRRKIGGSKIGSGASSTNESRKSSGICLDDDEGIGMGQYSPAIVLPKLREPVSSDNGGELETDSLCEEDMFERHSPTIRRKRSNSEATNYLIMRKTSRPDSAEVLGSLDRHDDAYKQLLTKFTCYDLMPTQGAVVVIDCQLPTRRALVSLSENGVRAALLWDAKQRTPICFLTVTDLLRVMCTYFASPIPKTPTSPIRSCFPALDGRAASKATTPNQAASELADILRQPILSNLIKAGSTKLGKDTKRRALTTVGGEDVLQSAVTALRSNRLHRVAVLDMETGNPLYLLSAKRLLHFLYNHMTNLPLPQAVYKSLDELRLGTWIESSPIASVNLSDTIMRATEKFLESGVSSLPVLEICVALDAPKSTAPCSVMEMDPNCTCKPNRLLDALTKVDLLHFILVNGWMELQAKTVADVLKARSPNMEKLVTCHRKTPLSLAIDRMIQSNAHRVYIVDSSGVLEGLLSVGDLLSYLLD